MPAPPIQARLDALLAAAGLCESSRREDLLEAYLALEGSVDALYRVPGVRYESPALIFAAAAPGPAWGEADTGPPR